MSLASFRPPAMSIKPKSIARFANDARGGVAIMFAIILVPLLLFVGVATDYASRTRASTSASNAADAAALAVGRVAYAELLKGNPNWKEVAIAAGDAYFAANTTAEDDQMTATATFDAKLVSGNIVVSGNYRVSVPTNVMKIAGISTMEVAGTASVETSMPKFVDFHFVVDVSGSMGVGATKADQVKLVAATGCQFACHYQNYAGVPPILDGARATGATLRIDVVREGIANALDKLPRDGSVRVAIYTFSNSLMSYFPLSSDIAAAKAAALKLELTANAEQGGSNVDYALKQLAAQVGKAGDGTSASRPLGVVMLATDAVEDSDKEVITSTAAGPVAKVSRDPNFVTRTPSWTPDYYLTVQSMSSLSCQALKDQGFRVISVQTKYLLEDQLIVDPIFTYIENTLAPYLDSNMKACASSPADAFTATQPNEIKAAIESAIGSVKGLRITN